MNHAKLVQMIKKPIVIIQHKIDGRSGNNICKDSAVAQQLIAANRKKAITHPNFFHGFSFIIQRKTVLAPKLYL